MDEVRFWSLIEALGGALTDDSLVELRRILMSLESTELLSFHDQLVLQMDRLRGLGLVEQGFEAFPPVGEGYDSFLAAVVARGKDFVDGLVCDGRACVLEADSELGMEFLDLPVEIFEATTNEIWPDRADIGDGRVLVYVGGGSSERLDGPVGDVEWGATAALTALARSEAYAEAAVAAGFSRIEFFHETFVRTAVRPTRGVARRKGKGLSVDIEINASGNDGSSFEDGVAKVREVVDGLARSYGLPVAVDVPELDDVLPGERPPDYVRFDFEALLANPALPPEAVALLRAGLADGTIQAD